MGLAYHTEPDRLGRRRLRDQRHFEGAQLIISNADKTQPDAAAAPSPGLGDAALTNDAAWDERPFEAPREEDALKLDLDGFSGPLDLLLALARTHRIDLTQLSVLALVEQYLAFIAEARRLDLEVAADYLVMAAWLAFLKSRLLLPKETDGEAELSGEELAARLAFRLQRLDAMRSAAAQLMTRKRLGVDVFQRGLPEPVRTVRETTYTAEIFDLLKAYAVQRTRTIKRTHVVRKRTVWSIKQARVRLEAMIGESTGEWVQLDMFLEQYMPAQGAEDGGELERTVKASSFGASLELAREGMVEIRQDEHFGPIYMRRKVEGADWERVG
jgi:segregation and condensation protein A